MFLNKFDIGMTERTDLSVLDIINKRTMFACRTGPLLAGVHDRAAGRYTHREPGITAGAQCTATKYIMPLLNY